MLRAQDRVADFAHVLLMSTAGSVPWLFAPETAFPAGSPLKSLPTLYLSGGQRVACVGVKGRQFVRLSEVRAWTEELEHQRARKAEDEARERRLRDEYAKQVDEQVDNVFLRRRVQELEAKLANQ